MSRIEATQARILNLDGIGPSVASVQCSMGWALGFPQPLPRLLDAITQYQLHNYYQVDA